MPSSILARLDLASVDYDKLVERTNLKSVEDMFAALGAGDLRLAHLVNQAQQLVEPERDYDQLELIPRRAPSQETPGDRRVSVTSRPAASQRVPRRPRIDVMGILRLRSVEQRFALGAVQIDDRAVHEARPRRGHEDGDVGHFLRRADAAQRYAALGALLRLGDWDVPDLRDAGDQPVPALRGHRARIDGIDADVVPPVLLGERDAQTRRPIHVEHAGHGQIGSNF